MACDIKSNKIDLNTTKVPKNQLYYCMKLQFRMGSFKSEHDYIYIYKYMCVCVCVCVRVYIYIYRIIKNLKFKKEVGIDYINKK